MESSLETENEVVEFESNFTSFDFTHNAHPASGSLIHKFSCHTQTYYIYSFLTDLSCFSITFQKLFNYITTPPYSLICK